MPKAEGRMPKASRSHSASGIRHVAVTLFVAGAVWLGMFDVLISRGVKEYLFRAAEHELGRGPAVTIPEIMDRARREAALESTLWALFVAGAGYVSFRFSRGT